MNLWYALYLKELKENKNVFLLLLVATLALDLYSYVHLMDDGRPSPSLGLALVPFVSVFIFPFVLLHSFAQEFKGQTHYQLLALPVPRAAVVMGKFLAVLTAGVALFVLAMGAVHLISLEYTTLIRDRFSAFQGSALWLFAGQFYFTSLLLMMGIATAMAGLKLLVRRFQSLAMTLFLVASLYLYGRVLGAFLELMKGHFEHTAPFADPSGAIAMHFLPTLMLPVTVLTVLFSLLFVGLGILLFERFAEA
ncbi:MAG: ABC transporter permease [Candidatus Latescibacteria bacterium]|nr:ABC transporter permease [Candidatus Latescibacterota bacterium]